MGKIYHVYALGDPLIWVFLIAMIFLQCYNQNIMIPVCALKQDRVFVFSCIFIFLPRASTGVGGKLSTILTKIG